MEQIEKNTHKKNDGKLKKETENIVYVLEYDRVKSMAIFPQAVGKRREALGNGKNRGNRGSGF